jgi:hypothetical protein
VLRDPEFLARTFIAKRTIHLNYLFLALSKIKKNALKGLIFADILDNVTTLLRDILYNDFQDCLRQWQYRLTKCTASQGEYSEGDNSR